MPLIRGNRLKENFMYLTTIVNREVKKALRQVFIQAWDGRHPLTPWDDTGASGFRLHAMESRRPQAKPYLSSYSNGNSETWDCSALIDAILYSNAIGKSRLHVQVANAVNDLRDIRNKIMHNKSDEISDDHFTALIKRIKNDFSILGVSKENIDEIIEEKSMYTSFIKLPPSSLESHEQERLRQNRIDIALEKIYIGENWGKLFLLLDLRHNDLELFGNAWLKREQKKRIQNHFVMTLDGRNEESILKSYKDFSSQVNCDDDITSEIMESGMTEERKIMELKSQVQSKIKNWNSWLIMVTDVEDLEKTMHFLPQRGEGWENGLILVSKSEFCFGYWT